MAIDGLDARSAGDRALRTAVIERNVVETQMAGPLERLVSRPSPLDRLVADAGALGKFRTDVPEALPAGTSAFTRRSVDTTDAVAARMALPRERVWAGALTPPLLAPNAAAMAVAADRPPAAGPPAPEGTTLDRARPAVATDTDNQLAGGLPGNSAAARA